MEWARTCRYKIPGDYREIGGEPYFFFDLSVTDIFTKAITETGRVISKRLTEATALEDGNDNYHQLSFQIVNGSVMFGYEDTPLTKEATDEQS